MGSVSGQEITTDEPLSGQVRTLVLDVKDTPAEAVDNLKGGVPSLLAAALRSARTRLTSDPPRNWERRSLRRSRSGCRPYPPGSPPTRRENENHTPLPKPGTTRSVTMSSHSESSRPGGTFGANARKMAGTAAGVCTGATARA